MPLLPVHQHPCLGRLQPQLEDGARALEACRRLGDLSGRHAEGQGCRPIARAVGVQEVRAGRKRQGQGRIDRFEGRHHGRDGIQAGEPDAGVCRLDGERREPQTCRPFFIAVGCLRTPFVGGRRLAPVHLGCLRPRRRAAQEGHRAHRRESRRPAREARPTSPTSRRYSTISTVSMRPSPMKTRPMPSTAMSIGFRSSRPPPGRTGPMAASSTPSRS